MPSDAWKSIINRNLVVLSFVSLLNDFSTDMVVPLLPAFIYALGGGAILVGFMEGLADSIAAFLRYASGRISDRLGKRKAPTQVGYAISSVFKLFYAVATHPLHIVGIRAADRVGKGFREAPRDAMIAESVPRAYWGFGFGFHRMMDSTGAMLGPLAAIVLVVFLEGNSSAPSEQTLRTIFFIAAIPAVIALFLLFFVRETGTGERVVQAGPFIPQAALKGPLARYLVVTALFTLGHLSVVFLVLRATDLGFSLVGIIFLYTVFTAVEMSGSLPVGRITDRVGRAPILVAAYLTYAFTFGLVAVVDPEQWWALIPFFVLIGIARALREGQGRAFVADLTPPDIRATGFGAYHATVGLLALPAGLFAGWLWEMDYRWTFLAGSIFCFLALGLFSYNWKWGRFGRGHRDAGDDHAPAHVH